MDDAQPVFPLDFDGQQQFVFNAVGDDDASLLQFAEDQGYDFQIPFNDYPARTALAEAAAGGKVQALAFLLPLSDPNARDTDDATALMLAASMDIDYADEVERKLACLRLLAPVSDLDAVDSEGWSAFHFAAAGENIEAMKLLGTETNARAVLRNGDGTALHLATRPYSGARERSDPACVSLLLSLGADPHARDYSERTPFLSAATRSASSYIAALLPASDVFAVDHEQKNAIFAAAESGGVECVRFLAPLFDLDAPCGDENKTPLMAAATEGRVDTVAFLAPISNTDARDSQGRTALMLAAMWGHPDCARILAPLSNAKAVDHEGQTALFHAARGPEEHGVSRREETLSFLLSISDLRHQRNDGLSVFAVAADSALRNEGERDSNFTPPDVLKILMPHATDADLETVALRLLSHLSPSTAARLESHFLKLSAEATSAPSSARRARSL